MAALGLRPLLRPAEPPVVVVPGTPVPPPPHKSAAAVPSSGGGAASWPSTSARRGAVKIGSRWREYQGACNWDGLVDPLDHALCSELLRYGRFVRAAYSCFESSSPKSRLGAGCPFPKCSLLSRCGLPDTGYRVTRHLHATSSIGQLLPRWAEERAPSWFSNHLQSSWIGYVAVCQDEAEIARLGRRDVVIALRGTTTCLEWLENFRATLTTADINADDGGGDVDGEQHSPVAVETGFWSLYTSSSLTHRSLQEEIRREVRQLVNTYCRGDASAPPLSLTVTGHSLGAALAVLAAYDIRTAVRHAPPVTVVSFGGPRVGNASFRRAVEDSGSKVLRVVNPRDIVTKVPGFVVDDRAAAAAAAGNDDDDNSRLLINWLSKAGLAYSDVGRELQVSCPTASVAECHDLNLYLHLLGELSGSVDRAPVQLRAGSAPVNSGGLPHPRFTFRRHPRMHDDVSLCTRAR